MAVTATPPGRRGAVITRRGNTRFGLAQSDAEAESWIASAVEYRGGGPADRVLVTIRSRPGDARPRIGIRKGTRYDRLAAWSPGPGSVNDPRHPRRRTLIAKLPADTRARTLAARADGLVMAVEGPADEGPLPLDGLLRLDAAEGSGERSGVVLVMHVVERLAPWIAVSPAHLVIERF